jgi:hypothetical protein
MATTKNDPQAINDLILPKVTEMQEVINKFHSS